MDDDDRLAALMDAIGAHLDDPARPMPAVSEDDAAAISELLHGEVERGTVARDQQIVAIGHTVACARGCAACCETVIVSAEADVVLVARWLAHPDQAAPRQRFAAAYPRWRAVAGDLADRATEAAARGDGPAVAAAMGEAARRHAMCPFNHDGACDIYPVRPNVCRLAHALDTAAECRPGGVANAIDFVPITQFLARIRPLERALHAALPGAPVGRAPLADRVASRLGL